MAAPRPVGPSDSAGLVQGPDAVEVFELMFAGGRECRVIGDSGDDVGHVNLVGACCRHDPGGDVQGNPGDVTSTAIDLAGVDPDTDG